MLSDGLRCHRVLVAWLLLAVTLALLVPGNARDASDTCVSYKFHYSCAIRASDHTVECWHHLTGEIKSSPADQHFTSISCLGRELCGILHDGGVAVTTDLWPAATGTPATTPVAWDAWRSARAETSASHSAIACDRTRTCYIVGQEYTSIHTRGGQLVCWPDPKAYSRLFPASNYVAVAMAESSCLEEGSCSPQDFKARNSPICVIDTDKKLRCCCGSPDFMAQVPTSGSFIDVSISDTHGCAVHVEGGITCWGSVENGKHLAPNIPNGSGGSNADGLTINPDGTVQDKDLVFASETQQTGGESTETGEHVKFVAVSTATDFACGLLWNGATVCFNGITDTELEVANAGCALESVVSDGYVSCGRLLRSHRSEVPTAADRDADITLALARAGNSSDPGPSTGVFCWQSFPEAFLGLQRVTESWSIDSRRVPIDIRPSLDVLALCMALPQREAAFDLTRLEALAIALVLATTIAFSAYRMVILKRFGDFSWSVTVADHLTFWFGFISGLFDLVSQALFVFMDATYISFRAMYLEANMPFGEFVLANTVVLILSCIVFVYCCWVYSKDEFGKITLQSPVAIAKKRFLLSGATLLVLDVPQMVFIGIYSETMIDAALRPSATAIFSAVCCCVGPVIMVIQNYYRARNATEEHNEREARRAKKDNTLPFGDLAAMGAGPMGTSGRSKPGKPRGFIGHKMFGSGNGSSASPNRVSPAPATRGSSRGVDSNALIAAASMKRTQAKLRQLASQTSMRKAGAGGRQKTTASGLKPKGSKGRMRG